jgi:hypothetical protein
MPPDQNQNQQRVRNSAGVIFIGTAFSSILEHYISCDRRFGSHLFARLENLPPLQSDAAHVRDNFIIRFIFHPL